MRWVTRAPVYEVDDAQFELDARQLIKNVEKWQTKSDAGWRKEWNADLEKILNEANVYKRRGDDLIKLVYRLAEGPVALMILRSLPDCFKIEDLAAHAGAKGGGVIMVEWAVTHSETNGKNGIVKLIDAAPEGYYTAMGFEDVVHPEMRLVPRNKPDLWTLIEGEWKLKKYLATPNFLEAIAD